MPIAVKCPNCKARFELAQLPGLRALRCPECRSMVFPVMLDSDEVGPGPDKGTSTLEKPPPDEKANKSKGWKATDSETNGGPASPSPEGSPAVQLRLTYVGLGFHYVKVILSLVGILLGIAFAVLSQTRPGTIARVTDDASTLVGAVTVLLGLMGSLLCCQVPTRSRARALIVGSLAADGLAAVLRVLMIYVVVLTALRGTSAAMLLTAAGLATLSTLTSLLGLILFLLFLKQLAYFLDEKALGDRASDPIIYLVTLIVASVIAAFVIIVLLAAAPCVGALLALVGAFALLIYIAKLLLMILNTIGPIRNALGNRLDPSQRSSWRDIPIWAWASVPLAAFALLAALVVLIVVSVRGL